MAVIQGATSGNLAEVDANNRIKINLDTGANPAQVGGVRLFSENDTGSATGTPYLVSPETDDDYRLRVSQEALLDTETFNYTTQNTGKFQYRNTTMTIGWSAAGMQSNSGTAIVTNTTGVQFNTYAEFPILGASNLYCEIEGNFNAAIPINTIIEFGMVRFGTTNPYTASDGIYFRATSAGLIGVINSNGTETPATLTGFTPTINQKYQFILAISEREVEFWIDGTLYATTETPAGQGQPCMSSSLPFAFKHIITGGNAGAPISFFINDYTVSLGGTNITNIASTLGNRIYGSYQSLSGLTTAHGQLAGLPISTALATVTATATTIPAGLPGGSAAIPGLGGVGQVPAVVASGTTDYIWAAYLNPLGTANIQGRRLIIRGVMVDAFNSGAAVGATPNTIQLMLAFGNTAVSQGTAEAVATKAPRRVGLGMMYWPAAAPIGATPTSGRIYMDFGDAPIFVNPGEYVSLVAKHLVGTNTASQTITFIYQPVYGWE